MNCCNSNEIILTEIFTCIVWCNNCRCWVTFSLTGCISYTSDCGSVDSGGRKWKDIFDQQDWVQKFPIKKQRGITAITILSLTNSTQIALATGLPSNMPYLYLPSVSLYSFYRITICTQLCWSNTFFHFLPLEVLVLLMVPITQSFFLDTHSINSFKCGLVMPYDMNLWHHWFR